MLEFMYVCYEERILKEFSNITNSIFDVLLILSKENRKLDEFKDLILSKMVSES
jgi:hypothetical protein